MGEEEDRRHKDEEVGHPRAKALGEEWEGRHREGKEARQTQRGRASQGAAGTHWKPLEDGEKKGEKKEEEGPGISANWTTRGEAGRDSQQWRTGQAREPWEDMESRSVGTETKQGAAG